MTMPVKLLTIIIRFWLVEHLISELYTLREYAIAIIVYYLHSLQTGGYYLWLFGNL